MVDGNAKTQPMGAKAWAGEVLPLSTPGGRVGATATLVTDKIIEQFGRTIKLNWTPDTTLGAGLNRRLDCGKCSTPRGLSYRKGWMEPQKPQPKDVAWAGDLGGARRNPAEEKGATVVVRKNEIRR